MSYPTEIMSIKPAPEMVERKIIGPQIHTLSKIILNLSTLCEAMKIVADPEILDSDANEIDWLMTKLRKLHVGDISKALSLFEEITFGHFWCDWTCREEYGPESFPVSAQKAAK